jgi:SNF2 family DNA or RNA helicase
MNLGLVKRVLVICPLSCVEEVWVKEIFGINPSRIVHALTGPNKARKALLKQPSHWVITNHDACTHLMADLIDPSTGFDLVVADEATAFKTESASRTRGFKKIVQGKNFWLLTGTPTPQNPTDAYMLCKLINPKAPQTMARFQNETMYRLDQYTWLPKHDAVKTVAKYMTPSIRFDKKDCLDMPPVTFEVRKVPLTKEQTEAIKDLRTQWVFEAKGDRVVADRAAVRLSKVLQIGQGCVIGDAGVIELDVGPRIQTVLDLIAESESKTIVFASFRASLERLEKELSKHYGVGVVHGDVSSSERSKVFDAFKTDPKCRVLLAHPATTSHGLTLTSASTTIWFGPYQKFEAFEQANERMNRPGQKHDMRIIGLEGMTEEKLVFNAARKAGDTQADLMELKRLLEL